MARTTHILGSAGAALGLAIGTGVAPVHAAPSTAADTPDEVKVLQLNLWHQGTKIDDGIAKIADIIEETDADVMMLSEAGPASDLIRDELNSRGNDFSSYSTGDSGIVSRFPISDTSSGNGFAKGVVTIGDKEVAVYSGHLEYQYYVTYLPRGYGGGTPAPLPTSEYGWDEIPDGPITDVDLITELNRASGRPDNVQKTVDAAAEDREAGRSVLIGGDFNEPSHLDWTERAKDQFDHNGAVIPWDSTLALEKGGFKDSYRDVNPNELTHPGITWPAGNKGFPTSDLTWAPKADERDRIDYVFDADDDELTATSAAIVGPKTSVVRNEFQEETSEDEFITPKATWPTDHKGNLITYKLGNEEEPKPDADDETSGDENGDENGDEDKSGDDNSGRDGAASSDDQQGSADKQAGADRQDGTSASDSARPGGTLPRTGAELTPLYLGGALLAIGAAAVYLVRRRKV